MSGKKWFNLAKGGAFSKYYSDLHIVVDWSEDGDDIKRNVCEKYPYLKGNWEFVAKNASSYFLAGLTWSRRSQVGFSLRVLPEGSIFSDKGSSIIGKELAGLLGILNSSSASIFIESQMAFGSYEVGVIANMPLPLKNTSTVSKRSVLAFNSARQLDTATETSHAFRLPWLLQFPGATLVERFMAYQSFVASTEAELARLQNEIDELAFDLYELSEEDRTLIRAEMSDGATEVAGADAEEEDAPEEEDDDADDEEVDAAAGADLPTLCEALLSWCVGAAFGRWDVRMAQDQSLIPKLQGPFERLPVVAPAGLVGVDGYPAEGGQVAPVEWLRARPDVISLPEGEWHNTLDYPSPERPLTVAWDGVLVSDVGGPNDLSSRVRAVLRQVFGDEAEAIEDEALRAIQGNVRKTLSLEDYLRGPKHFFATHLKGYSRSRRKAPIYWPLSHKDAPEFVVWVYYPRMTAQTLPRILTEVVLPRLDLARADVDRLRNEREANDNARTAKALEQAEDFARGLTSFERELRRIVDAGYTPEHDDGVILTASPLHSIFGWKDLPGIFKNVQAGKYPWSHQHSLWANKPEQLDGKGAAQ